MKLIGKIIIKGSLVTKTGLHLGGSKSSLNIGGIDNNVIKTALDRPYIPGSSIKGKLRSLLAKAEGSLFFSNEDKVIETKVVDALIEKRKGDVAGLEKYKAVIKHSTTDEERAYIMDLFGYSGDSTKKEVSQTRLLVRDAFLKNEDAAIFKKGYTDSKWENVINRRTGTAEHPRQLERVPVGASFGLELVYNIFEDKSINSDDNAANVNKHLQGLLLALQLLEDDGIGGSISRGYGQVKVNIEAVDYRLIDPKNLKYESVQPANATQQQLLAAFTHEFSPIN